MKTHPCIVALVLVGLNPCSAVDRPVDFSSYQRIPDELNSRVLRALLKSNRYTSERGFHGRYGGCGNHGGRPVDTVDALCRKHDIIYATAKAVPSLRLADRVLVTELAKLDARTLTPAADGFRRRAMAFMSGPCARCVGKPPGTWFRRCEPGCSGPVDEKQLTQFFRTPVGKRETLLLVSMVGKDGATARTPNQRPSVRPITRKGNAALVAKFHSANRGKL